MAKTYDFLIIGAGIFGLTTAIALVKKGHSTAIINPDQIPHPLAASTDISKIVRMEYGADLEYMEMVEQAMIGWKEWNELFGETLYHETGFAAICKEKITDTSRPFEYQSLKSLQQRGHKPEILDEIEIAKRYPALANSGFIDGFWHAIGGFAESGRTITVLKHYFQKLGGNVFENQTAQEILSKNHRIESVKTKEGHTFQAGHIIVCAGNSTPYLLPELKPFMKITGHPVFHLKPSNPEFFSEKNFPVLAADIAKTGWYGFPIHPKEKVVKIANHSEGLELNPETDERIVYPDDEIALREFLKNHIPSLANDPIVYSRRCCYTDTLDGHFWIDNHPDIQGLTVASGGSGHGFKMGPIIGKMIANVALGGNHLWSDRFHWRNLDQNTKQEEEARNLGNRVS